MPEGAIGAAARFEPLAYRPVRHVGRWVGAAALAVLGAMLVNTLVSNPRYQWDVVWANFTTATTLEALWATVQLTVLSMAVGAVLGTLLAVMRLSPRGRRSPVKQACRPPQ